MSTKDQVSLLFMQDVFDNKDGRFDTFSELYHRLLSSGSLDKAIKRSKQLSELSSDREEVSAYIIQITQYSAGYDQFKKVSMPARKLFVLFRDFVKLQHDIIKEYLDHYYRNTL